LVEAGLLDRHREGALVFYRIAEKGQAAHLARTLVDLLPGDDSELNRDLVRLDQARQRRADLAEAYFKENAADWDQIRALHVPEAEVESRLLSVVGKGSFDSILDIGTGTGRILTLLADRASKGVGIDNSTEMLALARAQVEMANLRHIQLRKGDMYSMPLEDESIDLATLHLVLHYSLEPSQVLVEAARTLRPGGRLVIVDFAPHEEEQLRTEHKHQRLGFSDREIRESMEQAGLVSGKTESLEGDPLTVNIWQGSKPANKTSLVH